MKGPVRVLLVQGSASDAQLIEREIRRSGIECVTQRVEAEQPMLTALQEFKPDVVLSDQTLPHFEPAAALRVARQSSPGTPVIIVTGPTDEETAADYIKAGAVDYIVKDRLHRLGPAIQRALALRQEQVTTERARARSEQRFRTLVEHSSDGITLLDAAGAIQYSTHALHATLGYAPGEREGHSVFEMIHPDDRPAAEQLFREGREHPDQAIRGTLRLQHKNGSWRHLDIVGVNRLLDPAIEAIVVNYHDVTARYQAEETLRRTADFLTHTQAAAHVGSWEWNVATNVVTWSAETYRLFGISSTAGALTFEHYVACIHPEDRGLVQASMERALKNGREYDIDHRITYPDGSVHFLHARGGVVTDDSGEPLRMLGTVLDITERKESEEALRHANERLRAAIDSSPLAIFSLDPEGAVQTWNAAAERLFGWAAREVIGQPIPTIPEGMEEDFHETRERVLLGESLTGVEQVRMRRDGTPVPIKLFAAPLHDADGRITGILGLVEDQTNVKRLEQQFFQAQKMEAVGRLAGGIAHDFNNILTAITANSAFLLEDLEKDDVRRQDVEEIRTAADRAVGLTRQLLAFSRQQVLTPTIVDVGASVKEMEQMLRRIIGEDITLTVVPGREAGVVKVDASQLEQVILNLAVNARDAMPGGGSLTIETANVEHGEEYVGELAPIPLGSYVMIAVSDTGVGMNDETKARLFEPFFTTKEIGRGTGLGLATVYGIVKQSEGHIWVYSEPGRGATFKIYLPRVNAAAVPEPFPQDETAPVQGAGRILLVEDDFAVRAVARRTLERGGYTVLEAGSPGAALKAADVPSPRIQLLLTDVVMPGMDGRALAVQMESRFPGLRVLYMSGYPDAAIVNHGVLEPGMVYLQKPFTPNALLRKVREALSATA